MEKLTICFDLWICFDGDEDYERKMQEIKERGFNCIRFEDCAGLLWDEEGNVRDDISISPPFGKYTKYTTYKVIKDNHGVNLYDRLIRICRAAKKYDIKIILSSWFYLHTNWFVEKKEKERLMQPSTEEKMVYFADELDRILSALKKENLIDVVAFAEVFNEFDGLPFSGGYIGNIEPEKANELRILHEREIEKLKNHHPDVLFAFDTWRATPQEEIIPRNIDVFNFHFYYAWGIYQVFEKGICKFSLDETEIAPETAYYLKDEIVQVKDILSEMKTDIVTGLDWPRRISLYSSIDDAKKPELEKLLDDALKKEYDNYKDNLREKIEKMIEIHDKVAPNSKIVMGEGGTYCASVDMCFERNSETLWNLFRECTELLKEKGVWGTVIRTNARPSDAITWDACKEKYIELNKFFLNK